MATEDETPDDQLDEAADDQLDETPDEGAEDEADKPTGDNPEVARLRAALAKANADAKRHRLANRDLVSAGEDATAKAKREAGEAAEARYKPAIVRRAAREELAQAGIKGDQFGPLLKLLDVDSIELDDDLEPTGVKDAVDSLRRDFPALFPRKGGAGRIDGGPKGAPDAGAKLTPSQRQANLILGK